MVSVVWVCDCGRCVVVGVCECTVRMMGSVSVCV